MFFDFIIIGSGLAGLNSAIEASKKGSVLLITKTKLQESNTRYAQGGIAVVISQKDSFKKHIQDTLVAGAFHNNKKAVDFIIRQGPAAIQDLIKNGVLFQKNSQHELALNREGGHSHARIVNNGDQSGLMIQKASKIAMSWNFLLMKKPVTE